MPNENKSVIKGHIGKEPTLRYGTSGTAICSFSVATNSGKDDAKVTDWHNVVTFGDLAEEVAARFHKGAAIHIEGPTRTRKWTDNDGATRYTTEVLAYYVADPVYRRKERNSADDAGAPF